MNFHAQNLNDKPGDRTGSMIRHGRCWLEILDSQFRLEWSCFRRYTSLGVGIELADYDDDAIGGHLALGYLGALYWGFQNRWLRAIFERITSREKEPRVLDQCSVCRQSKCLCLASCGSPTHIFNPRTYWLSNGRTIGVCWYGGDFRIDLWNDPMESRSVDPWWWHITICPSDLIFGRTVHSERDIETSRVIVSMPEGGYPSTVRMFESTWHRPRWPWAWRRIVRAEITPDVPIPFPGKGSAEYNCGEDSTHSMTVVCKTPLRAAMALAESVMDDRLRYGNGWKYRPQVEKLA